MTILIGDCVDVLRTLPGASVDAICTDPPYGIAFMGKEWDRPKMLGHNTTNGEGDVRGGLHYGPGTNSRGYADNDGHAYQAWCEDWARELLRVAKPGAHMLAFGSPRTYHRMACAIEDAGWEIRDCIQWVYAEGFPKSLNVSKAMDKKAGAVREVIGVRTDRAATPVEDMRGGRLIGGKSGEYDNSAITAPSTDEAKRWEGWGTGLKPANEPIVVARKPLVGTVIENVRRYGTGALNIDACRIGVETRTHGAGSLGRNGIYSRMERNECTTTATGRWPANLLFDEESAALLDAQSGQSRTRRNEVPSAAPNGNTWGGTMQTNRGARGHSDEGGASRFYFVAKPSPAERTAGVEERMGRHPTQKPVSLMRHLVRLVTPPGGTVLDPFCGSGTTGVAALVEGMEFIGIEREEGYATIANARIAWQGGTVGEEGSMFTDEDFIGDNLVPAGDLSPISRQIDMWNVVARPFRSPGSPAVYWQSTVGGNKYGPYQRIDDLFGTIERQIGVENDRAAKKHRYGGAQDGRGRANGADQRPRKGHVL